MRLRLLLFFDLQPGGGETLICLLCHVSFSVFSCSLLPPRPSPLLPRLMTNTVFMVTNVKQEPAHLITPSHAGGCRGYPCHLSRSDRETESVRFSGIPLEMKRAFLLHSFVGIVSAMVN